MNTRIDKTILPLAQELITRNFGNLGDLPAELQNTIANIYYAFSQQHANLKTPGWAPTENGQLALKSFNEEIAHVSAAVKQLPELVEALRESRGKSPTWAYDYSVVYTLDVFKYRLPRWAINLPAILRAALRLFSNAPSKEIPNLCKLLH